MADKNNQVKSINYYTIQSFHNFKRLIDNCQVESTSWLSLKNPLEKKGGSTMYMAKVDTSLVDHSSSGFPKGQYHGVIHITLYYYGKRLQWLQVDGWNFPTTYMHEVKYATKFNHLSECNFYCIAPNGKKILVKTTTYSSDVLSSLCVIIRHIISLDYEKIQDGIEISGDFLSRLRLKYGG